MVANVANVAPSTATCVTISVAKAIVVHHISAVEVVIVRV